MPGDVGAKGHLAPDTVEYNSDVEMDVKDVPSLFNYGNYAKIKSLKALAKHFQDGTKSIDEQLDAVKQALDSGNFQSKNFQQFMRANSVLKRELDKSLKNKQIDGMIEDVLEETGLKSKQSPSKKLANSFLENEEKLAKKQKDLTKAQMDAIVKSKKTEEDMRNERYAYERLNEMLKEYTREHYGVSEFEYMRDMEATPLGEFNKERLAEWKKADKVAKDIRAGRGDMLDFNRQFEETAKYIETGDNSAAASNAENIAKMFERQFTDRQSQLDILQRMHERETNNFAQQAIKLVQKAVSK